MTNVFLFFAEQMLQLKVIPPDMDAREPVLLQLF